MKTLDEVIEQHEFCLAIGEAACGDCRYRDQDRICRMREDALYHLKMYRSDMRMYAENQKYWENELKQKIKDFGDAKERYIAKLKELDVGTLNAPLTWDELKQMKGKPVYVICHTLKTKGWALVDYVDDDRIDFALPSAMGLALFEHQLGKTWQAYRKERE